MKKFISFAMVLCLEAPVLMGATSQNVVVNATVPAILSLDTSASTVAITLVDGDYNASGVASKSAASAHNLLVRSNRAWQVAFKSTAAAFSFAPSAGDPDPAKPNSALSVRTGAAAFAAVTTSDQVLKTGNAGPVGGSGNTFAVDYLLASDLSTDKPGVYSLTMTYTVTTP